MKYLPWLAVGLLCTCAGSVQGAEFSFVLEADKLKAFLEAALPQNALYLIVASERDSNFDPISGDAGTQVGASLNGPGGDDVVVYRGAVNSANGTLTDFGSITFTLDLTAGDRLALIWIPNATTATANLVAGTHYGLYSNTTPIDGSSAWLAPTAGTQFYSLGFYTQDANSPPAGSNPAVAGAANLTVVPEPGSAIMALAGAVLLGLRRRR